MTIEYSTYGIEKADDKRQCLGMSIPSGCDYAVAYAYMVNDDFSVKAETVYRMDFACEDMRNDIDYRVAVNVDATPETIQKVRAKCIADHVARGEGLFVSDFAWRGVKAGDVVKVVKGRKYPYGMEITVSLAYAFRDCYGRYMADYVLGTKGEKVDLKNCEIVSLGNGSLPTVKVGDTIEVIKDITNPVSGEIKYKAGTLVVVAGTDVKDFNGKKREYYLGNKGERIYQPFARLV